MAIIASQAKNFVLCPRRVYLDIYGPQERKLPFPEFLLKKAEEGEEFEAKVISKIHHEMPLCEFGNWPDCISKTKDIMEQGAEVIYHAVLAHKGLFGIPDLLEKRNGKSRFGDFYYTVTEIKTGLSVKEKYLAQVMFYVYLLSKVQGFLPRKAYLILGDESRHEIDVDEHMEWFKEKLNGIKEVVGGKEIEPSRVAECPHCPWYDVCFGILLERKDISLLYKLTKKAMQQLKRHNITSLDDVRIMDEKKFAKTAEISEYQLKKWKAQAESLVTKKPVVAGKIELPSKKTEIFLDFESEDKTHYMIGVLVRNGKEKVRQFIAHKREDEGKAWKEFLDFISKQEDFVIYHYGIYERKALRQLIEKYGISKKLQQKIFDNLFDLLKVFYEKIMLPTWSYSLKPVAKYLGFEWRNPQASGELAMLWYDSYIKTKGKKFINMIKEYNEDDLIATKLIKDWLREMQE